MERYRVLAKRVHVHMYKRIIVIIFSRREALKAPSASCAFTKHPIYPTARFAKRFKHHHRALPGLGVRSGAASTPFTTVTCKLWSGTDVEIARRAGWLWPRRGLEGVSGFGIGFP